LGISTAESGFSRFSGPNILQNTVPPVGFNLPLIGRLRGWAAEYQPPLKQALQPSRTPVLGPSGHDGSALPQFKHAPSAKPAFGRGHAFSLKAAKIRDLLFCGLDPLENTSP
jgi:hypothetical protein